MQSTSYGTGTYTGDTEKSLGNKGNGTSTGSTNPI